MAQRATAFVAALARNAVRPAFAAAVSMPARDVGDVGLVEVDDEQQRLGREELKSAQPFQVVACQLQRAQRLAFFECDPAALNELAFLLELCGAALLQIFLETFESPLDDAEVGEDQLVLHRLRVARRVDRARCMRDRRVAKRADDVHEGVGVLVAGDVDERLRARLAPGR